MDSPNLGAFGGHAQAEYPAHGSLVRQTEPVRESKGSEGGTAQNDLGQLRLVDRRTKRTDHLCGIGIEDDLRRCDGVTTFYEWADDEDTLAAPGNAGAECS